MTPSLPIELLKTIFRYATYSRIDPYSEVTHTMPDWFAKFEKDNLDVMETKLALTRASRCFRRLASEFLFEFVSLDKPNQAVKLVTIMNKQSSNGEQGPCEWVKFLFVNCSIARLVTKILRLCNGLRGLSWNPTTKPNRRSPRWTPPTKIQHWTAQDEMILYIPTSIQFLNWNGSIHFSAFAAFLRKPSTLLQVLHIRGVFARESPQLPLIRALYPSLTHLCFTHVTLDNFFQTAVTWKTPALMELSIVGQYERWDFPTVFSDAAKNLRVLRLGYYVRLSQELLSRIFDTFANLQEICYRNMFGGYTSPWALDVTSTTMKKVGLYISYAMNDESLDDASSRLRQYFSSISKTRFPSLDTIIVDGTFCVPHIPANSSLLMRRISENFGSAEISVE